MEQPSKKLSIATLIVAIINVAIFALAFTMPTVAFWLAISAFAIYVILICIREIFIVKLIALLEKTQEKTEKIEDDAEREKQHIENAAVIIFTMFIMLILLPGYQTWRKRLLGLLISSLLSISVIVYSGFWGLGQNMIAFLHIISVYLFIRALVHFTLNPLGENKTFKVIPHILKVVLELVRILLLGVAALSRDGNLAENVIHILIWEANADTLLAGVVATMAIDSILVALRKTFPEKEVNADGTKIQEPTIPV